MPVNNRSEYWRVDPPSDDADPVVCTLHVSPQPAFRYGETLSYEFLFNEEPGETRTEYRDRHADLLGYDAIAGQYASGLDIKHRPWFREQHPRRSADESALAAIRPPDAMQTDDTGRGLWCLVEAVEDITNVTQTRWGLALDVEYLADLGDYNSADEVRADFEADGI
jgi:hypothetical protein